MHMVLLTAEAGFSITEVITLITDGVKGILPLFTEFPLNFFLGAGIVGVGVGFFKRLKH